MKEKLSKNISKLKKVSKPVIALAALAIVAGGFGTAALVSADSGPTTTGTTANSQNHPAPGIHGQVTAVNGTTLTVTSTNKKDSTTTTYTVDASSAKVVKFSAPTASTTTSSTTGTRPARPTPTTITVSGIAVGDTVNIRGTVSGTNVTATEIMDGVMGGGRGVGGPGGMRGGQHGQSGTITAINGSTVTITGKNGTTYTVNASNATLEKISTISVSDLAVGDTINANGTTSGTTITATHILDGALPQGPNNGGASAQ